MPMKARTIAEVSGCAQLVDGEWQALRDAVGRAYGRLMRVTGWTHPSAVYVERLPQTSDMRKYIVSWTK